MASSTLVDFMLDSIPQEHLISFFRHKKTEMAHGIDDPKLFLYQLRDHSLVPEDVYQKVIKMKSKERKQNGVYTILECLEKEKGKDIKLFWICVFQEHILQKYPFLRSLKSSLLDGSPWLNVTVPTAEKLTKGSEEKAEKMQGGTKRKKSDDEEEDAGPSSVSSSSQKKPLTSWMLESSEEEFSDKEDTEQEEEEKEESESVDISRFEDDVLPVICGSITGALHKGRFAGSCSKSIRTEECWFTPEEFVKQDVMLKDGHWKKDILCYDTSLDYLVKMKILDIHPEGCRCQLCHPKDPIGGGTGKKNAQLHQDKDDVCFICDHGGSMVCCSKCPRAFHHNCHLPTLQDKPLGSKWMCTFCVLKTNEWLQVYVSRKAALSSPVSENLLRCEYLLMKLYKADKQHVCTDDPSKKEESYSSVISNPMWLDKVKTKLQQNAYKTVRMFVHDIYLIFDNCQTFYKDNTFGRMGAIMKKIFQKEFETIFKNQ